MGHYTSATPLAVHAYMPLIIKGMKVHPENPILFDFIILCIYFLISCKPTTYIVSSYDKSETTVGYVYLLKKTTFPKFYRELYTSNMCSCMMPGDTIYFTRDNDSLVPNKVRYRK